MIMTVPLAHQVGFLVVLSSLLLSLLVEVSASFERGASASFFHVFHCGH